MASRRPEPQSGELSGIGVMHVLCTSGQQVICKLLLQERVTQKRKRLITVFVLFPVQRSRTRVFDNVHVIAWVDWLIVEDARGMRVLLIF